MARRKGLCLLLALLLVFSLGTASFSDSRAITLDEIQSLRDEASKLEKQRKELQAQINSLKSDQKAAMKKKSLLDNQIAVLRSQISNTEALIQDYETLIRQTKEELAQAEEKERIQYQLFCQRVRAMEEKGTVSYWSVLFHSNSFSDLLGRLADVREIMGYDQSVIDELKALQAEIAEKKAALEEELAQQQQARDELVARQKELKNQEAEVEKLLDKLADNLEATQAAEKEMREAAAAMDEEVRKAEKAYAEQLANSGVVSEKGYLWPLPSANTTLTSLFGSRIHPITGKPNNHTGIDIRAAKNTKIYAAKSGMVITSTYNRSYGNYVVVSHTDGSSTLYAHMNSRAVKEGEIVTQGQVVGYVGTTGSSNGYHLHFEVRINGVRKDPVDFYPSATLYVVSGGKTQLLKH